MGNIVGPNQMAFSEAVRAGCTLSASKANFGSAKQGFKEPILCCKSKPYFKEVHVFREYLIQSLSPELYFVEKLAGIWWLQLVGIFIEFTKAGTGELSNSRWVITMDQF